MAEDTIDVTRITDTVSVSRYSMSNAAWKQTVYDHRSLIIKNSITVLFSMEDAHYWRFRLQEYAKEKYDYPQDAVWIVNYVNNIQQIDTDGGILEVLFPKLTYLESLRDSMDANTSTL